MVKINNWQDSQLAEAVLIWTGYGNSTAPIRDNSLVIQRFGSESDRWLALLDCLVDDFYESKANLEAVDIQEMWRMAIADFQAKHPNAPENIIKALAWCYTFDYR